MCGCGRGWGDEVGLLWRRVAFGEIDFYVGVEGVAEGVFGKPGEEEGSGGFRACRGRG